MYLLFKSILSHDIPFLIRLYKIYVRSILDFGSSVYNSNARQISYILEKVQRRFTCLIFYRCLSFQYPQMPDYAERLKILNLESLESQRRKADLLLFHKILNGNVSLNATSQISSNRHISRTNPRGIVVMKSRLEARSNFFLSRVGRHFRALPKSIQNMKSESEFKYAISENHL